MTTPPPPGPCPWCHGVEFVRVDKVFVEVTDFGRAFSAVTCKSCGHTAWFAHEPPLGTTVTVAKPSSTPYR